MLLNRWKMGPKIYLVVCLMALVTAVIGGIGVDAIWTYNNRVQEINRASDRAVIGERVNGLIYAVVMDSRGIYMSSSTAESEKFAPLVLTEFGAHRRIDEAMDGARRAGRQGDDGSRQCAGRRIHSISHRIGALVPAGDIARGPRLRRQ